MTMEQSKRERLEKEGWKVGSASDFLELSSDESAYIDLKLELARRLQKSRLQNDMTQASSPAC